MIKFAPIQHQFSLFDYEDLRLRGLPSVTKHYLTARAKEGKAYWKQGNMRKVYETLSDMNDTLENLDKRISNKKLKPKNHGKRIS